MASLAGVGNMGAHQKCKRMRVALRWTIVSKSNVCGDGEGLDRNVGDVQESAETESDGSLYILTGLCDGAIDAQLLGHLLYT